MLVGDLEDGNQIRMSYYEGYDWRVLEQGQHMLTLRRKRGQRQDHYPRPLEVSRFFFAECIKFEEREYI